MQTAGKLSAKKPAAKATTSGDDDVQILKSTKRKGPTSSAPSASRRRSRALGSTLKSSTPEPSLNPCVDLAKVVADLSSSTFPGSACFLPYGDLPKAFESVQFDLLQVMSQIHHIEDMVNEQSSKKELESVNAQLKEEKNKVLVQGKEIKSLQLKLKNSKEAETATAAENTALTRQLEETQEELCGLKLEKESFEDERMMVVSGAKVTARWELMREWLKEQTDKWELVVEFQRYKLVKEAEAKLRGLPPPSFDDEPPLPEAAAAKETSPAPSEGAGASPTA